jgi:hypothetical protein
MSFGRARGVSHKVRLPAPGKCRRRRVVLRRPRSIPPQLRHDVRASDFMPDRGANNSMFKSLSIVGDRQRYAWRSRYAS